MPKLSLVLGGASSGKSKFAEQLVTSIGGAKVYVATAQAFDSEMKNKIAAHRAMRGEGWLTIEEPVNLGQVLADRDDTQILLLECATLWLTNLILSDIDTDTEQGNLLAAIADCACPIVVVSNEAGLGIVPDNALSRKFRVAQGRLNQALAAEADLAVMVTAGLPQVMKGQLPQ